MDNPRLLLFIALCFTGLLLFQAWQRDYGQPAQPPAAATEPGIEGGKPKAGPDVPTAAPAPKRAADVPAAPAAPEPAERAPAPAPAQAAEAEQALASAERIHVRTDVLDAVIDTVGGDLRRVDLLDYPVSHDDPTPYRLLADEPGQLYVAQSGFAVPGAAGRAPDHTAVFTAAARDYRLAEGQDELRVRLQWQGAGLRVTKTYVFRRGDYHAELIHEVENTAQEPWQASFYRQLQRVPPSGTDTRFIYTYTGAAIYTPEERYEKIDFEDMADEPLDRTGVDGGWVAMLEHYFLGAWLPGEKETNAFYSLARNGRYYIGMKSPLATVAPGETRRFTSRIYAGPKLQDRLEQLAPGLELTVDYGVLTFLSKPLFWVLKVFHSLSGNWGWAIVLVTLLIKLVFYKLSETSYRSMAKMRNVQPRMQALKERYGDDKQKLNQALMDLYKREKINPLGGCLPVLVQIPVFIALYWVLLESVELRQAPFILWIQDLSTRDPYFVLPVLMGISMVAQQKLNPAPLDPLQQKLMMSLPIVFTVFFAFFPAGLVLYWFVNNALSILQQWVITKRVARGQE